MPIPEPETPDSDFWPRVKAHRVWPATDEDALRAFGDAWLRQSGNFLREPREVLYSVVPEMAKVWPDGAGAALREKVENTANYALDRFEADVRGAATTCITGADHLARAKTLIRAYIFDNQAAYGKADEGGRAEIVTLVVNNITAMLGELAAQVRE